MCRPTHNTNNRYTDPLLLFFFIVTNTNRQVRHFTVGQTSTINLVWHFCTAIACYLSVNVYSDTDISAIS